MLSAGRRYEKGMSNRDLGGQEGLAGERDGRSGGRDRGERSEKSRARCRSEAGSFDVWMKAGRTGATEATMNTEIALSADALAYGRPVDGFDARDRKIIGSVVRALQRLLENDGVTPAHQEDQRAQIVVRDGKILVLAAVSSQAALSNDDADDEPSARPYRLPPLQTRQPRTFAFG